MDVRAATRLRTFKGEAQRRQHWTEQEMKTARPTLLQLAPLTGYLGCIDRRNHEQLLK